MDFKFNLIGPEIRLVMDTDEGVQHIEASAEQLLAELPHSSQASLVAEIARAYTSENSQSRLAERITEIIDENMTPAAAVSLINNLKGKYNIC